jgi:NifB/MoaA-like Fe-S oxidoreductase
MFAPRLASLLDRAGIDTERVRVVAVPNDFFGRAIGVAGLLTGRDIQRCLSARPDLGRAVLLPSVALRDVDGVFLDDQTPADLARDLGAPVRIVATTPRALLKAIRDA